MVDTREIASEYRLSHWAQVMQARAESGLSIKAYCKQLGICGNTYFYWQRRVRAAAAAELGLRVSDETQPPPVCFRAVSVAERSSHPVATEAGAPGQLHIDVGGIRLMVDSTYPVERLAELLRSLNRPC